MPPRLQPLRTAQQHIAMNKNDSYTYPPPPILPQPQFYTTGAYQLADYAAPNFTSTLPPPSLNLSSDSFVKISQLSSADHEKFKHFQFDNQKIHPKAVVQKIHPQSETRCPTTILKSEYCQEEKPPKSRTITAVSLDTKNFPVCLVSDQCDYIANCESVKLKAKAESREQIKSLNLCQMSQNQINQQGRCPKITKVRRKPQKSLDIKTATNKKKPIVLVASMTLNEVKSKKTNKNNKVTKQLNHKLTMLEKLPVVERTLSVKKAKTKKLCEGWRWSGKGERKLVYLNVSYYCSNQYLINDS